MSGVGDTLKKIYKTGGIAVQFIYVNVVIFLVIIILNGLGFEFHKWLSSWSDLPTLLRRPWTVISYMFAHKEFSHIFGNMVFLFFFGSIFNQFFNNRKFVAMYFGAGLAGLLLYILSANLLDWSSKGFILGASASVIGLVWASAAYKPDYELNLFGVIRVKLIVFAAIYSIYDLYMVTTGAYNSGGHLAHLGGAVWGAVWAIQYRTKGQNIGAWIEVSIDWVVNLFKSLFGKGSKMKVVHRKKKKPANPRGMSDEEFNENKLYKQKKIDSILDKISKSGYDALSKDEKDFLSRQK